MVGEVVGEEVSDEVWDVVPVSVAEEVGELVPVVVAVNVTVLVAVVCSVVVCVDSHTKVGASAPERHKWGHVELIELNIIKI